MNKTVSLLLLYWYIVQCTPGHAQRLLLAAAHGRGTKVTTHSAFSCSKLQTTQNHKEHFNALRYLCPCHNASRQVDCIEALLPEHLGGPAAATTDGAVAHNLLALQLLLGPFKFWNGHDITPNTANHGDLGAQQSYKVHTDTNHMANSNQEL